MSDFNTSYYAAKIPERSLAGLIAWAEQRHPVGQFLTAVLSNDLLQAVGRADEKNLAALREICQFVYNEMPSKCHGSPEKVKAWMENADFGK